MTTWTPITGFPHYELAPDGSVRTRHGHILRVQQRGGNRHYVELVVPRKTYRSIPRLLRLMYGVEAQYAYLQRMSSLASRNLWVTTV